MTVKKTQYTKAEILELAKRQYFGSGSLAYDDKNKCVLGWLLSLSGVHTSRMRDSAFVVATGYPGQYFTDCNEIIGIKRDVALDLYHRNDWSDDRCRTEVVAKALGEFLPDGFVLDECDEELKEAMAW